VENVRRSLRNHLQSRWFRCWDPSRHGTTDHSQTRTRMFAIYKFWLSFLPADRTKDSRLSVIVTIVQSLTTSLYWFWSVPLSGYLCWG